MKEFVRGDVVIISPKDRLTVETEEEFRRAVRRLLDGGQTRLLLDLATVPAIDSCGLGAMIAGFVSARRRGGALKLVNASGHHVHLLAVTKLVTVFELFDSEEEAVRSFMALGRRKPTDPGAGEAAAKI
jgi:anti-sigma B factor antagonist